MSSINSVRNLQMLKFSKKNKEIKKLKKRRKIYGPESAFIHTTHKCVMVGQKLRILIDVLCCIMYLVTF